MLRPTWDDLAHRNLSASSRDLSGRMRVIGATDTGAVDDRFYFRHKATDRWWIERNGTVVYVSATDTEDVPVARVDGQMVYQRRNNRIRTGRRFSPDDLFGLRSMVIRRSRGSQRLAEPRPIEVDQRPAWEIVLVSPDGTRHRLVFDDATGVLVDLSSPDYPGSVQITDLHEHHRLPASQVTWDGSAMETSDLRTTWLSW